MKIKKILTVFTAVLLLICFFTSTASAESSDLSSYLSGLIGTPAKEWGRGTGTQCVELPKYYIEKYFGLYTKTVALGNGNGMYKDIPQKFPHHFTSIKYYDGLTLKVGDIVSYHSDKQSNYGHAAVVYAVNGKNYSIIEQAQGSGTVKTRDNLEVKKGVYGKSYTIIGVARPKYTDSSAKNIPKSHDFGEWETVKAATCTEKGQQKHTCKYCPASETKTISALGHKYGDATVIKKATCSEKGVSEKTCTVCGKKTTISLDTLKHQFSEEKIKKQATETETGLSEKTCKLCGKTVKTVIPKIPVPAPAPESEPEVVSQADSQSKNASSQLSASQPETAAAAAPAQAPKEQPEKTNYSWTIILFLGLLFLSAAYFVLKEKGFFAKKEAVTHEAEKEDK